MRSNTVIAAKVRQKREKPTTIGAVAHNDAPELSPAQQLGRLGGAARARALTAEQRRAIA
jgi:hypothetical protein